MLSSHLMSETALIADHLVIVGRGRLLADTSVADLVAQTAGGGVKVATTQPGMLRTALSRPGVTVTSTASEELLVTGMTPHEIGFAAAEHRIPLYELSRHEVSLEEAFMDLTRDAVEYTGTLQEATR